MEVVAGSHLSHTYYSKIPDVLLCHYCKGLDIHTKKLAFPISKSHSSLHFSLFSTNYEKQYHIIMSSSNTIEENERSRSTSTTSTTTTTTVSLLNNIPTEVMVHALSYLPMNDVTHNVSLVSTSFLEVSRRPELYHTLDFVEETTPSSSSSSTTIWDMTQLLNLLRRPQFAKLKKLVPPEEIQLLEVTELEIIAKCCPLLEDFDVGTGSRSKMTTRDEHLEVLPQLFPHLTNVGFNTGDISDAGIANFCETMGSRLKSIRICDGYYCYGARLTTNALKDSIAMCCPNLEHFECNCVCLFGSEITDDGIIPILKHCRKLKNLIIGAEHNLEISTPLHILKDGECTALCRLYIVEHDDENAVFHFQLNEELRKALMAKIECCEIVSYGEHAERQLAARERRGRSRRCLEIH